MLKYLILQPLARVWIGTVDVFKSRRKDRIYMCTRMNIPSVEITKRNFLCCIGEKIWQTQYI